MDKIFWPENINRNRPLDILDSMPAPLTLVVAPMGYGKTTLVHTFLADKESSSHIWLELEKDSEPDGVFIWHKICDGFKAAGHEVVNKLVEYGLPMTERSAMMLARELKGAFASPFYVVLDNYQEYEGQELNSLFYSLSLENVENLHIVIISRVFPEIPYEELWMKKLCLIVEQGLLTLSREEIGKFFRLNDAGLTEQELETVVACTEGWVSAVYLVLLEYKRFRSIGSIGGIARLMKTSVFDNLTDKAKNIFMRMSLFDYFTAEQAAYVTEYEVSQAVLHDYVRDIGFIKYNNVNNTFQLHTLLKAVAGTELEHQGIDKRPIYRRCARWYERKEAYIDAIRYFRRAGDTDEIYRIIEEQHCYQLYEEAPRIISQFFEQMPPEENYRHEQAYLTYLYTILVKRNSTADYRMFKAAEGYYLEHYEGERRSRIEGELKIVESCIESGSLEYRTQCIREAYELLKGSISRIFDERIALTFGVPGVINLYHDKVGCLKESVALAKQYTSYYMQLVNGVKGGWDELYDAEYYYALGKVEKAKQLAHIVWEKSRFRKQVCIVISSFFVLSRCDIYLGNVKEYQERLRDMEQEMKQEKRGLFLMDYDLAIGFLCGTQGDVERVPGWIKEFDFTECNTVVRSLRTGSLIFGLVLIRREQWARLEALAEEMLVPYGLYEHVYVSISAYIYLAVAKYHLKNMEEAKRCLKRGLEIARPDGIVMPFVESSMFSMPVLEALAATDDYAKKILRISVEYQAGCQQFQEKSVQMLLTERERSVMELVTQGMRNQEIAKTLNIAPVTVEKTLTNVYRKLEVTNRTAAITKLGGGVGMVSHNYIGPYF